MGPAVLHAYGFNGACVDTGPAIDAGIRVDDGLALGHADGVAGALLYAGLTTGAFCAVHFCRHSATLSKIAIVHLSRKNGIITHSRTITRQNLGQNTGVCVKISGRGDGRLWWWRLRLRCAFAVTCLRRVVLFVVTP